MSSKEIAYQIFSELVERFEQHLESYKSSEYNETLVRRDFIDPFFKALGWDVDNSQGYSEAFREVVHEDKLKVSGETKAPDYSFRIGGRRIFFVEAKKPSIYLKEDISVAYQIRRYGWSAKLAISILTDFEEFAVYDCTIRPYPTDKASTARIRYLTFREYLKEFDFLWDTFSKEVIQKGGLEKFIQSDTQKKGSATVDKEFLGSLETWRKVLAHNVMQNHPNLTEEELNFVVQIIIDRIVFLRIAEDRSVELYGTLKDILQGESYYQNLFQLFKKASYKYNSGLFDFYKDNLTQNLQINNKVIKEIISELYYPKSSYEFSVIPVEILGSAYEQFLGKTIRITQAHNVKVEEKPEVRKSGGVYYTPQYIVDYIVENTVGKLIEGKSPKEISKLRILDPACGSGSFLLGAYEYLLRYHKEYYTRLLDGSKGNKKWTKASPLTPDGNLSTNEKKRILMNNIYGVDVDANAVEVTKLSLLLKCLEGETEASIEQQLKLFHDTVLPDIDSNILCGNSLVDMDYLNMFGREDERLVKPFSWELGFPHIFSSKNETERGFDIVIGNPPYVSLEDKFRNDLLTQYFRQYYQSAYYKIDLYHLFIEKGLKLLKKDGLLGCITPSNYFLNNGSQGLRNFILENSTVLILNIIKGKVFSQASVDTAITILSKGRKENHKSLFVYSNWLDKHFEEEKIIKFQQKVFNRSKEKLFTITKKKLKVKVSNFELGKNYYVKFGMQLRNRKKYKSDVITSEQKKLITKFHRPCYTGKDVKRWFMSYSNLLAYFNKEAQSGGCWDEEMHNAKPKIIVRQIGKSPICALDEKGYCCLNTVFMVVPKTNLEYELKFILAILNSKFIEYFWKENYYDLRETFPKIKGSYLERLPIPSIDFQNKIQKEKHDKLVQYVDEILELYQQKGEAKLPHALVSIQQKIDYFEKQINQTVYELYGLSKEEIVMVEESS